MATQWDDRQAEQLCRDLLGFLTKALPEIKWGEVGVSGDDGLIFLTNIAGRTVKAVISRQVLEEYRDGTEPEKERQRIHLASHMTQIYEEAAKDAEIRPEHLE